MNSASFNDTLRMTRKTKQGEKTQYKKDIRSNRTRTSDGGTLQCKGVYALVGLKIGLCSQILLTLFTKFCSN